MVRFFQIIVLICTAAFFTGCRQPEKEKPIWEQIKLSDVATTWDINHPDERLLKTINFDIHIFEMPAKDYNGLNNFWEMMYAKPLHFNNYDAFHANSFSAGFGQISMWNTIAAVLRNAGGEHIETVSLLLFDGETKDFTITRLNEEQTVFYIANDSSMEGVTIRPGKLVLRIKVEKVPGERGVCVLNALPVFTLSLQSAVPQLAEHAKSQEFLFKSAGLFLKMSPGDFVLFGPEKYIGHQITLGSLFFSTPKPKPIVRMFLLICTRVID
jgi:hypothetical protein